MGKYMKKIHKQASTVIDSECNSDPIARSATPDDLPEEKEDDHFGVVLYSEPLDEKPKASRKLSKQKRRTHRYKSSWEQIDAFKEWIQPSDKSEYLAFCLVCNSYLKGASGRNDITKHSKTEVHLRKCRQFNLKRGSDRKSGTLKKKQPNADAIVCPVTPPTNLKHEAQASDSEMEFAEVHLSQVKTVLRKEQTYDDEPSPTPKRSCSTRKKLNKLETEKNRSPELVEKYASFIQTSRDESQIFGDYVASAIRDLTDDRNKKRLKILIQKSIIEVQETDGENIHDKTYYPDSYSTATSVPSKAPVQVGPTEEVSTVNMPSMPVGILPVEVEAAEGQYRYNLLC